MPKLNKTHLHYLWDSLFILLFAGILLYLFSHFIKPSEILSLLSQFPLEKLGILLLISTGISAIRAWRFYLLLQSGKIAISFWEAFKVFVAGQALAPLPGGEAARGVLLNLENETDFIKSVGPLLSQGFIELMAAAFFTVIGSLIFKTLVLPALATLFLLVVAVILITNQALTAKVFKKLPEWAQLESGYKKFSATQKKMRGSIFKHETFQPSRVFLDGLALASASTILGGFLIWLIAHYYAVNLSMSASIFVYASSIVLTALAFFAPGGLGVAEGGMTGILFLTGVAVPQAIAIVVIFRVVTLVYSIVLGLIFLLIFYSKPLLVKRGVL